MIGDQFKVLVLTDHRGHSESNSLYALMQRMVRHKKCSAIHIANRGISKNKAFFEGASAEQLFVYRVDGDFQFSENDNVLADESLLKPADYKSYDLVLLRLPRPISDDFLLWLEEIFGDTPIINRPSGIIKTSNKAYLLQFPECCPPMELVYSLSDIMKMSSQFPIVLKPLREYGGKGILKIEEGRLDDGNRIYDAESYLSNIETSIINDGYLAMKFLKNVDQGDKRIIVVGGTIMASSLRMPRKDSWLCNVAQGGTSIASDVTPEEKEMIKIIAPKLREEGVLIYGVDTLVNDDGTRIISEINTLSVGGFANAQEQSGLPIIQMTIDKIFNYAMNG